MTTEPTFDERLDGFIKDGPPHAPGQLLGDVLAAIPTTRQRRGAVRFAWRTSPMNGFTRLLAGTAVVVAVGAAALFVVPRLAPGGVGGVATPPPVVASASPTPSATPADTPSPTVIPSPGPCAPADLEARITLWEGAAGHRIAHVELSNAGSSACVIGTMARPQLVDGGGAVLIDGVAPTDSTPNTIEPGAILKTLVQDSNYCGPDPVAPVTVAFVQADGTRIVATPASPTDATVPPCLGAPGSQGDIEMHPWAP
jgi:Protein of unknown function (DUF4232)